MADEDDVANVMLGEPGEDTWNTLVLGGTDVVVPVERDPDGDPFQDDEVWLCALDGTVVQRRYASDDEVDEDEENRLLLYRFTDVRYGVYNVWTKIGGRPSEIARGLVVRREGVFAGESALPEDRQGPGAAPETIAGADDNVLATTLDGATADDVDQSDDEDEMA
jgi:hypothetical protein